MTATVWVPWMPGWRLVAPDDSEFEPVGTPAAFEVPTGWRVSVPRYSLVINWRSCDVHWLKPITPWLYHYAEVERQEQALAGEYQKPTWMTEAVIYDPADPLHLDELLGVAITAQRERGRLQ